RSRTFGLSARAQPAPTAGGKSYFLEHLLKQVVFREAGLAGVNRSREMREAAIGIAAYALVGLVTVLGIVALVSSYRANRAYVAEVQSLTDQVLAGPVAPDGSGAAIETV